MTFRFSNKTSTNQRRKSTIIIEEQEDSLLVEPVIKDFLQTQNSGLNQSQSKILARLKSTPSNKNATLIKLSNTSEEFYSTASRKDKIINPQKLTYISQINLKTLDNWESLLPHNSVKKQPASMRSPLSATKIKSTPLLLKKQYANFLDTKKRWAQHLLKKTIIDTRKKLDQSIKQNNHTQNANISSFQSTPKNLIKTELLKNVSNSTWMKLNPQNIKQNMIFLSKTEKQQRKSFFAMKQASIKQQHGIKSLNKLIMFGRSVSNKKLNHSKKDMTKDMANSSLGVKINLSAKNLVNQKVYEQRIKRREQLQKKGIFLRDPFNQTHTTKHDVIINVESQFL